MATNTGTELDRATIERLLARYKAEHPQEAKWLETLGVAKEVMEKAAIVDAGLTDARTSSTYVSNMA